MPKKIAVCKQLTRAGVIERDGDDGSKLRISISSNTPYKRYDWMADEYYWEVLSHAPGDVDTERLKAGLPILFNHKRDSHLARATKFENDGSKIIVTDLIWSESKDAQDKLKDVIKGALPDTSVGYQLIDDGIAVGVKDGMPIYEFKWAPYEASIVTIPADISVGVGRDSRNKDDYREMEIVEKSIDAETNQDHNTHASANQSVEPPMKKTILAAGILGATNPDLLRHLHDGDKGDNSPGGTGGEKPASLDVKTIAANAIAEHKAKCKKIDDFCATIKDEGWRKAALTVATKHKEGDANFDEFRAEALNAHPGSKNQVASEGRIEVIGDRPTRALSVGAEFVRLPEFVECGGHVKQGKVIALATGINALGARGKANLAQRAGFTSSDLSAINIQIQPGIIGLGIQRLTIMDLISPGTTGAAAVIYPQENSFGTVDGVAVDTTNGAMPKAGTVGERGVKPKWEPDLTTVTANVKKIAVTADVPDEFLADFPQAESFLNERLPYMVDTKTEEQILYGDGVGNNLKGIFTFAGVQTRAITTTDDSTIAASLRQGLTDISVGSHFEPDGYAFHPYDWETAQLLKDDDKRFLAGGPFYIPLTNGVFVEMRTFWGKPVVVTTAVNYGSPLAGSWKLGAQYFLREGMRLEMSNANKDNFERNMITVRAEHRLAVANYRPPCFLEFTGFPARA